jgi:hypothetical protein
VQLSAQSDTSIFLSVKSSQKDTIGGFIAEDYPVAQNIFSYSDLMALLIYSNERRLLLLFVIPKTPLTGDLGLNRDPNNSTPPKTSFSKVLLLLFKSPANLAW